MTPLAEAVKAALEARGLIPDRIGQTVDDSTLMQFRALRRCVDVYPTGEVVVIVKEGDASHIFELTGADVAMAVDLVQSGMAACPKP